MSPKVPMTIPFLAVPNETYVKDESTGRKGKEKTAPKKTMKVLYYLCVFYHD